MDYIDFKQSKPSQFDLKLLLNQLTLVFLYLNCVSKSEIIGYDGLDWF